MKLFVSPASFLKGRLNLPASKSYSIRAFLIAACGGKSTIINASDSDDAFVARRTTQKLGCRVKKITSNAWQIDASSRKKVSTLINVGESGTTLRFLLPLAALSAANGRRVKIVGRGTLVGRPNHFLNQTLRKRGVRIHGQGKKESVPIILEGSSLRGGSISIDGSLSSQFISALLIACPQLKEDTMLTLKGHLVSSDYITMTQQILAKAGIKIKKLSARSYAIRGRQHFKGLRSFVVPSDYGLAAFPLAAAVLVFSSMTLKGFFTNRFIQADGHIISFLKKMGVGMKMNAKSIQIKGPFRLKGGRFSLKNCPDLVPIMAVLGLFARGTTQLVDIGHARAKESDRISDLRQELLKVGAHIQETRDTLTIYPQAVYKRNVVLDPHHDHRLAMVFSVLGLRLGVVVKDIECTSKSYPRFVRDLKSLGARIKFS